MLRSFVNLALVGCCAAAFAGGPVVVPDIDGVADTLYCQALAVQDTQTGFGDADQGTVDFANGSELDAAYGTVIDGMLYLVIAGNLQSNGNDLELFFDTRAGGQNQLRGDNPDVDFDGLNRLGDDGSGNGLTFDPGFEADFYITVSGSDQGNGYELFVNYAELRIDDLNPGVGFFAGMGRAANLTVGGALTGADAGAPVLLATINNSNTGGVTGGFGAKLDGGADVVTGLELAIPLSALGNPAGDIRCTALVNGQQHDFLSNQSLAGQFGGIADNLGEPRDVDFGTIFFNQFFTISVNQAPCGACCVGTSCEVLSSADCTGQGGTYLGDGESCDGNPCDQNASGACCVGNQCTVETLGDCTAMNGFYVGDDTDCSNFPCQNFGACCLPDATCIVTDELTCVKNNNGEYLGGGTSCADSPCATGACCVLTDGDYECQELREEECLMLDGTYAGDGTDCQTNPCVTGACCIDGVCFLVLGGFLTCSDQNGGQYLGDGTDCSNDPCGAPNPDVPVIDGVCDPIYGAPLVIQDTQTQFGDATLGQVDFCNGTELDSLSARVVADKLYLCIAGNLESNFNKLELFFDTRPGGQNTIGLENPDVDFGALQRLGDDGSGNGLTFDAGFEADFYFTMSHGGSDPRPSTSLFANYVDMFVDGDNPGFGLFLGEGRAANFTNGGLLDRDPGGSNPFGILVTLDNSNTAGVDGGDGMSDGSGVTTGIEICIPLRAIGNPTEDFKVTMFINGSGHDFASNQFLAPLGGGGNLGEPRNIDLSKIAGDQCVTIPINPGPPCGDCGDSNCDGNVSVGDINFFVAAVTGGEAAWNALFPGGVAPCDFLCANDTNGSSDVSVGDINDFVNAVTSGQPCQP